MSETNVIRPYKVVVTGGAGFIGSHLVERLLNDGHDVAVIDNFSTGRMENLAQCSDNPRLTVHRADVSLLEEVSAILAGVNWVFHLAALAALVPSIQRPLDYHRSNVDGTVVMLEAARAAGVNRFLYAASSSCYGMPDQIPTPETAPVRTMYPYSLTKFLGEQCVLHWYSSIIASPTTSTLRDRAFSSWPNTSSVPWWEENSNR